MKLLKWYADVIIDYLAICVISLLVGGILIGSGVSSLEATEYGLDYSWISKTVTINKLDFTKCSWKWNSISRIGTFIL